MLRDQAIDYGLRFVGLPYLWGGDDPILGFDCSGLAQEVLSSVGKDPDGDQTAQQLYETFKSKSVGLAGLPEKGSLAFYGKSVTQITHVAVCIGDGLILEAGGGRSATTTAEAAAKQNAYIRVRPMRRRADLVAVVDPFKP